MSNKPDETRPSSVTVERSGARSVDLGRVLNTERAREQLRQIQRIEQSRPDGRRE